MAKTKVLICPYCGETQPAGDVCRGCGGTLDPLSRQASHNAMGPWTIRDEGRPFFPGCSYETLVKLVERGQVTKYSILRGPTTKQFWTIARHVPGIAHLVGFCHACDAKVNPTDHGCPVCGVPFGAYLDRNYLGLPEVRPLPGEVPHDDAGDGRAWNAPPMTPRGISSFAEDSEVLVSNGVRVAEADPAPPPASETPAAQTAPTAPDRSWRDVPAVRSMERRVHRQQQTIRRLIALVIVVALGSAVLSLLALRRTQRATEPAELPAVATDQAAPPVEETPVEESTPLDDTDPSSLVLGDAGPIDEEVAPVEPDVSAPAPAPPPSWQTTPAYEEAMTLVSAARDRERPLDDRITDLEVAIERLAALTPELEVDADVAALRSVIDGLELDLERLRLEAFFPG